MSTRSPSLSLLEDTPTKWREERYRVIWVNTPRWMNYACRAQYPREDSLPKSSFRI